MKFKTAVSAVLVAATSLGSAAQPLYAAPPAASAAALRQVCDEIAAELASDGDVTKQVDAIIPAILQAMVDQDAGFAEMNRQYPGMTDAVAVRVRPLMIETALAALPQYRADLSAMFTQNFTLAEARAALAFFRSPEGRAIRSNVVSSMDFSKTATGMAKNKGKPAESDLRSDTRDAGAQALAALDSRQRGVAMAFFGSPAGRKFIAMVPQKQAIDRKWLNYSPPGASNKIAAATVAAMIDHIEKTDPVTAKRMRTMAAEKGLLPAS